MTDRLHGTATVKGKTLPVEIHEIFEADAPETAERKERAGRLVAQGFPLYVGREFATAHPLFNEAQEIYPEPLTRLYAERCLLYQLNAPDEDWNGSEVMQAK